MSEKRFHQFGLWVIDNPNFNRISIADLVDTELLSIDEVVDLLNEQQEWIEELQVSDEMGWKRAEHFEKKCPKELHNKNMYIKRLEYKVQKFKEMNDEQQATIKAKNEYQRILEAKIRRLKDRIKVLEKNE